MGKLIHRLNAECRSCNVDGMQWEKQGKKQKKE